MAGLPLYSSFSDLPLHADRIHRAIIKGSKFRGWTASALPPLRLHVHFDCPLRQQCTNYHKHVAVTCPRCGKSADVLDAQYDFVGNAINVSGASKKTIEIFTALQTWLRAAQGGEQEQEILAEIEKASPELAFKAQDAVRKGGISLLILLLLTLLHGCTQNIHETVDWNELVDQAHSYITGSDPYPIVRNHTEAQESDDKSPKMTRQQRRKQERQSRKQGRQVKTDGAPSGSALALPCPPAAISASRPPSHPPTRKGRERRS